MPSDQRLAENSGDDRVPVLWMLGEGSFINVRAVQPQDEAEMIRFHESLSERTVYFRYFHLLQLRRRTEHERLSRICASDPARDMVLIAKDDEGSIVAVARLSLEENSDEAEFAVLVADAWQHHGIGTILLRTLLWRAREQGLNRVFGLVHPENVPMQRMCRHVGLDVSYSIEQEAYVAECVFANSPPPRTECHLRSGW